MDTHTYVGTPIHTTHFHGPSISVLVGLLGPNRLAFGRQEHSHKGHSNRHCHNNEGFQETLQASANVPTCVEDRGKVAKSTFWEHPFTVYNKKCLGYLPTVVSVSYHEYLYM